MFGAIRRRLLSYYLAALVITLGVFAIAARIAFAYSLKQQLIEKLTALGQGAAANVEYENQKLRIDDDFSAQGLIAHDQAVQWFDLQGHILGQQGYAILTLPLTPHTPIQEQAGQQGVTVPVFDVDHGGGLIGYVRASQSLKEDNDTLQRLDWGLGGGIITVLAFSGLTGLWLTRQAMQPIEQSFQRLQQFTADASHELRSPLMAIRSNTEVALRYPEGIRNSDAEKFEAIASATQQMTSLTENLLTLARLDRHLEQTWDDVNCHSTDDQPN